MRCDDFCSAEHGLICTLLQLLHVADGEFHAIVDIKCAFSARVKLSSMPHGEWDPSWMPLDTWTMPCFQPCTKAKRVAALNMPRRKRHRNFRRALAEQD